MVRYSLTRTADGPPAGHGQTVYVLPKGPITMIETITTIIDTVAGAIVDVFQTVVSSITGGA